MASPATRALPRRPLQNCAPKISMLCQVSKKSKKAQQRTKRIAVRCSLEKVPRTPKASRFQVFRLRSHHPSWSSRIPTALISIETARTPPLSHSRPAKSLQPRALTESSPWFQPSRTTLKWPMYPEPKRKCVLTLHKIQKLQILILRELMMNIVKILRRIPLAA